MSGILCRLVEIERLKLLQRGNSMEEACSIGLSIPEEIPSGPEAV